MPVDPWATTTAQEFPAQEPDTFRRLAQIIAAQKRAMFDIRASVLANVSDIVADLRVAVDAIAVATAAAAAAAAAATAAVADIAAAQATLTAQQATLTAAVADIATLVGQQTRPDAGNASTNGAVQFPTSGDGSFATITFNVPAGYTVASVVGNSSAAIALTGYSSTQIATRIAGLDGPAMTVYDTINGSNGSSNFSRILTGLSGGTFTVETLVINPNGGGGRLTTAASVTFSR